MIILLSTLISGEPLLLPVWLICLHSPSSREHRWAPGRQTTVYVQSKQEKQTSCWTSCPASVNNTLQITWGHRSSLSPPCLVLHEVRSLIIGLGMVISVVTISKDFAEISLDIVWYNSIVHSFTEWTLSHFWVCNEEMNYNRINVYRD